MQVDNSRLNTHALGDLSRCPSVSTEETLGGKTGIVDLWYWFYDSPDLAEHQRTLAALLDEEEQRRYARFRFEKNRLRFLAGRAIVRTVLSSYFQVAPKEWLFEYGSHGKPGIASPMTVPPLYFSLTKTSGLVACAVSQTSLVGVDAEAIDRRIDLSGVAGRYFAPVEAAALSALPPRYRPGRFFAYWTLKESYVKARGVGLSLPLDRFWFDFERSEPVFHAEHSLDEHASEWRFALLKTSHHRVATSLMTGGSPLLLRAAEIRRPWANC